MPGGVEIDVSAALARSIEDINKASDENSEGHLLVLLACKFGLHGERGEQFHFFTFWVCLLDGPPNIPKQQTILKLDRWNYGMMLNKSFRVPFLTGDESYLSVTIICRYNI